MWNRDAVPGNQEAPQAAEPARVTRPVEERRLVAWSGKSVFFKGDLTSSEDLTIDGRVEGTIELRDHHLTIGPDADIRATIIARTVTILGTVTGAITAGDKIDISETGSVEGNIVAPHLAMADGAVLRGRVDVSTRGQDTSKDANNPRPRLAAVV
jgi:cytoskeletal protein CcmA (bactofilin family)